MKVCLVIPSFYPAMVYGGPIYSTLYACRELIKLDVTINVASTNSNGKTRLEVPKNKPVQFDRNFTVTYYHDTINGKFSLKLLLNVWRDIKYSDIIHIQSIFSTPTPIALFYSWLFRKKVLLSPRGSLGEWCIDNKKSVCKGLWLKLFIKPFSKRLVWHATSVQEKEEINKIFANSDVRIIPNGFIDLSSDWSFKNLDAYKSDKKLIISMGRIHSKKGFDILIKSFTKIKEQYPDSKLLIAGKDDGEQSKLQVLINALNLRNDITFVGHLEGDAKIKFLSEADVFALPSFNENFGNVYAEALAAGTPIVASTNTPWEEVELAGCGRWVSNTVEDTAKAILDLLSRNREQLRQKAITFVKKYDWKNIAIHYKELYDNLV